MNTWAILATGPSLTPEVIEAVRGKVQAAAVSDAYRLAPWADILVSTDPRWWRHHPEAQALEIPKYAAAMHWQALAGVESCLDLSTHVNSGLLACHIAIQRGARRLLLCGFDFRPGHFFGDHPEPLKNTTPARYEVFQRQFASYRPRGVEIINCTPDSGLRAFPVSTLEHELARLPEPETRST